MSTLIMSACWPIQGITPAQKSVLISLADNANDEGVCWPSLATVSMRTCLSERAVRDALRGLEGACLLVSHQRLGRSTYYTVTPAAAAPRREMPPAPSAPHPGGKCPPPRQELPDTPADAAPRTVIEPKGEPKENRKGARALFTLQQMMAIAPADLSESVASDYHAFRQKKGALTETAWKRIVVELEKCKAAGISADDALGECMAAGWTGIKRDWLVNRLQPQSNGRQSAYTNLPVHHAREDDDGDF
ncbi:helix-turn-helix domain-containing protein [Pseudomonas oryzihabitans]|uniref:helix-turn-helix domain-containing protein n=1 Tax=Pseudomonas oryzihabitans TaxID=47885 RepID=UPI00241D87DC|nr:helix-turn-helix domain-containing protein [Pseudomonas oryzihabitans]